jgi:hypothetical protein
VHQYPVLLASAGIVCVAGDTLHGFRSDGVGVGVGV